MAANTSPIYPLTPKTTVVVTTNTANTARVDPPTGSSVVDGPAAGTNGARVDCVVFRCTVTNAVGLIQIWHKISSTYYLIDEILTAAVTPSTTVAGAVYTWRPPAGFKFLASGDKLAFTISKAEVWTCSIDQADY
jgi:hypothetical protein